VERGPSIKTIGPIAPQQRRRLLGSKTRGGTKRVWERDPDGRNHTAATIRWGAATREGPKKKLCRVRLTRRIRQKKNGGGGRRSRERNRTGEYQPSLKGRTPGGPRQKAEKQGTRKREESVAVDAFKRGAASGIQRQSRSSKKLIKPSVIKPRRETNQKSTDRIKVSGVGGRGE